MPSLDEIGEGLLRQAGWHPKHFHTVCLGGTHPHHALGPLNGPLRHSWGPLKVSFWPQNAIFGAPEVLGGPGGPDLVPTAADWSNRIGYMFTTHFGLISALFWAPWGPKRASFGPKCPFWGPQRAKEGPGGPNLVPTATDCSAWVKLMVSTHFGLVSSLFWAPWGPKRASFGPKCPF